MRASVRIVPQKRRLRAQAGAAETSDELGSRDITAEPRKPVPIGRPDEG